MRNQTQSYHIRILPDEKQFRLRLGELWAYRDLVLLLTRKTFTVTYQQTILGPLWIIIQPLLSSLVYLFIFGHIAAVGTDGIPPVLFYFVSSAVWELLSFSLVTNASTFVTNAGLFGKVYFPRLAVPLSNMLVSILKFLIQLLIVAVLMVIFTLNGSVRPMWAYYPLLPLLFLYMSLLGMSIGILVSSFTTKYRDLTLVVNIAVNLLMYASAVVYPVSVLPDGLLKTLILFNPAAQNMELIRLILLGKGEFHLLWYVAGLGVSILLMLFSVMVFHRVERTFADTV